MAIEQLHNSTLHNWLVVSVIAYTIYVIIMLAFLVGDKTSSTLGGFAVISIVVGAFCATVAGCVWLCDDGKKYAECGAKMSLTTSRQVSSSS